MLCGETDAYSTSFRSMGLVKIDNTGNMLWQRVVGTSSHDLPCSDLSVASNGVIYAGSSIINSALAGSKNLFIVKLSEDGVTEWVKVVGGAGFTTLRHVEATQDNGVLLTGATSGFG